VCWEGGEGVSKRFGVHGRCSCTALATDFVSRFATSLKDCSAACGVGKEVNRAEEAGQGSPCV